MVISDWSSDVCSSDLLGALRQLWPPRLGGCDSRWIDGWAAICSGFSDRLMPYREAVHRSRPITSIERVDFLPDRPQDDEMIIPRMNRVEAIEDISDKSCRIMANNAHQHGFPA